MGGCAGIENVPTKLLPEEVCENICGKMMGGMIGITIICLMPIKHLDRHDWEVDNDTHGNKQRGKSGCRKKNEEVSASIKRKGGWLA